MVYQSTVLIPDILTVVCVAAGACSSFVKLHPRTASTCTSEGAEYVSLWCAHVR